MVGFIFRLGLSVKNFGERLAHRRPNGKPSKLKWLARPVVLCGLAIQGSVRKCPVPLRRQAS